MSDDRLDFTGFESLLGRLADAWAACDAVAAAACFTNDAVYMEPPDRQLFRGFTELEAYFSPLQPGTYLDVHSVWFDEAPQTGAAEFSFGTRGADSADHGVVTIGMTDGRISGWREYHRKGPASFDRFVATDGKTWTWHAGNYP
jgi:ketosteroid isomerase-like protein